MKRIIFIIFIFSGLYAQCDNYNEFQCDNDNSCNWIENTETGSCSSLSVAGYYTECDLPEYGSCYSDCTNWGNYYGGLFCYGTMYCAGGNYQIDNSYCEEIQMPECSEMSENQCINSESCDWVEDTSYYSCSNFNQAQCNQYVSCSWTLQYGGSYGEWSYGCGGSYGVDSSYCEENQTQTTECADLTEIGCNHPLYGEGCEWIPDLEYESCYSFNELNCDNINGCHWEEDIQYGNCSNLGEASCDANPECYYDCEFWHGSCAGCCWGSCLGGSYIISDNSSCIGDIDNGYCTEEYVSGDINLDGSINVIDVVQLVSIILDGNYELSGDLNNDGVNNVVDVISLINIVLETN